MESHRLYRRKESVEASPLFNFALATTDCSSPRCQCITPRGRRLRNDFTLQNIFSPLSFFFFLFFYFFFHALAYTVTSSPKRGKKILRRNNYLPSFFIIHDFSVASLGFCRDLFTWETRWIFHETKLVSQETKFLIFSSCYLLTEEEFFF